MNRIKKTPLPVIFWKWKNSNYRSSFRAAHVNAAAEMVHGNTSFPVQPICITDDAEGIDPGIKIIPLWPCPAPEYGERGRPNCTVRLKMFSPEFVQLVGPRFASLDLDMVVTDNLDDILGCDDPFAMWGDTGKNFQYNGSLCVMNAGLFPQVWTDFKGVISLKEAHRRGFFGSDQAWISYKVGTGKRMFSTKDGVYSYKNHYRDYNIQAKIEGCKIVFFHGQFDPWDSDIQAKYDWVRDNYRMPDGSRKT